MNDREILDDFVRVERTERQTRVLVREIDWEGAHTPSSTWTVARKLPATATEANVDAAAAHILEDKRYFRVCGECEQRKPVGWMLDGKICQGCGERNHGVVF